MLRQRRQAGRCRGQLAGLSNLFGPVVECNSPRWVVQQSNRVGLRKAVARPCYLVQTLAAASFHRLLRTPSTHCTHPTRIGPVGPRWASHSATAERGPQGSQGAACCGAAAVCASHVLHSDAPYRLRGEEGQESWSSLQSQVVLFERAERLAVWRLLRIATIVPTVRVMARFLLCRPGTG